MGAELVLAVTFVVAFCSCAHDGSVPRAHFETLDEGGFTISQKVHARGRVRSDFEQAVKLIEEEDYAGSIEILEQVVADAPAATAAHINLAIAYRQSDDFERAEASLKRALELSPRHPVAHNELGIVYRRTGRFAEARESYRRALELYPGFHFARRNLAILCDVYLEDLECALENYELYAAEVPLDEDVAMWIADIENRLGR